MPGDASGMVYGQRLWLEWSALWVSALVDEACTTAAKAWASIFSTLDCGSDMPAYASLKNRERGLQRRSRDSPEYLARLHNLRSGLLKHPAMTETSEVPGGNHPPGSRCKARERVERECAGGLRLPYRDGLKRHGREPD
ncbi:uncharacterized protein B0I36DRAFT_351695 [Microdochium trichocladiopsis]|uniref:Uncharacterized protein n=1 Tax=Microdochium trichocladiopsis TaxID=1682393 RepID=A0A9P8Y203_9PEZI|nr:uncharacterized protein B0I36DRAFT_351695 [Microdochium trichocladiopsis]KAH7025717.1 hypothetical protein B0I36DRAFT_351695 [Microdochium trichocladiopsis]